MERKTYERIREGEFLGRKVKTLKPLTNGWCTIATGTICTVERKYNGLSLRSDPCPTCGIKVSISHAQPKDVDFIDQMEAEI